MLTKHPDYSEKIADFLQTEQISEVFCIPILQEFIARKNETNADLITIVSQVLQVSLILPSPSESELKTNRIGKLMNKLAKESENDNVK